MKEIVPLSRKIEAFMKQHEKEFSGLDACEVQRVIYQEFNGIMLPDAKIIERLLKGIKKEGRPFINKFRDLMDFK